MFAIVKMISFLRHDATADKLPDAFRNTGTLVLTKHVKCRMECRHITLEEIKEILRDGSENYSKSGKGDKTYAIEGYSADNQHIRVVVAPENNELVVITCIDLDNNWPCNCN